MKVYGPYTRKDGRKHVILYENGVRTTVSYPKWLMEQHLGRKLLEDETVDHIDRDLTNDSISNLRVISRVQHGKEDATRVHLAQLTCVECNTSFARKPNQVRYNAKRGCAGPFCSKSCIGKYRRRLQLGSNPLPAQGSVDSVYFKPDKPQ